MIMVVFTTTTKKYKDKELLLTTEALIDQFFNCVVAIKEEEDCNSNNRRKYVDKAVQLAVNSGDWSKNNEHIFIFEISDMLECTSDNHDGEQITREFIRLCKASDSSTVNYVLSETLKRLFAMASLSWFYESASSEIKVRLIP